MYENIHQAENEIDRLKHKIDNLNEVLKNIRDKWERDVAKLKDQLRDKERVNYAKRDSSSSVFQWIGKKTQSHT